MRAQGTPFFVCSSQPHTPEEGRRNSPGHIPPPGPLQPQAPSLTHIAGGTECPTGPSEPRNWGGWGGGTNRESHAHQGPSPWVSDLPIPGGPAGAGNRVEIRPKARLALNSPFTGQHPNQDTCMHLPSTDSLTW